MPEALIAPGAMRNGRGGPAGGDAPCYGAIDLGTNNCRLLIATPAQHGFAVVDAFSRIVRLGERLAPREGHAAAGCASGSQIWSGMMPAFVPKPMSAERKMPAWSAGAIVPAAARHASKLHSPVAL